MGLTRWTALQKDALRVALELDDSANRLSELGIEASFRRSHARLLRDLVEYVNDFRAAVSMLEAWPASTNGVRAVIRRPKIVGGS